MSSDINRGVIDEKLIELESRIAADDVSKHYLVNTLRVLRDVVRQSDDLAKPADENGPTVTSETSSEAQTR